MRKPLCEFARSCYDTKILPYTISLILSHPYYVLVARAARRLHVARVRPAASERCVRGRLRPGGGARWAARRRGRPVAVCGGGELVGSS